MRCNRRLIAAALAVGSFASVAQASTVFEQTFLNLGPGDLPFSTYGWALDAPGWYSGSYDNDFAPGGLLDAATGLPINGNSAVFLGSGGPLPVAPATEALGMFYTTEGSPGFDAPIDPSVCDRLLLTVYSKLAGGGADDLAYFAVRVRDAADERADPFWYIATTSMAPPTAVDAFFDFRSLDYHSASWDNFIVDETLAVAPVRGSTVGTLPSGLVINGVGVVSALTNPANDYSGLDYADYRILCVPEPTVLLLLALAAPAALVFRRRNK